MKPSATPFAPSSPANVQAETLEFIYLTPCGGNQSHVAGIDGVSVCIYYCIGAPSGCDGRMRGPHLGCQPMLGGPMARADYRRAWLQAMHKPCSCRPEAFCYTIYRCLSALLQQCTLKCFVNNTIKKVLKTRCKRRIPYLVLLGLPRMPFSSQWLSARALKNMHSIVWQHWHGVAPSNALTALNSTETAMAP